MKILTVLFCLSFIAVRAQGQIENRDTIDLARSKANEKKLNEANDLLTIFNEQNNNVYGLQLQAHVLYLMKEPAKAEVIFEKGLELFPDYAPLKLDYGRVLFQLKRFQKARSLFLDYLKTDEKNAEANISVAYIDLWNGRISLAKKRAEYIISIYPGNKEATDISQEIQNNTALYVKVIAGGYSDDQPMQTTFIEPEAGIYKSWWFSPFVKARFTQVNADQAYSNSWISGGDKIYISPTKTTVEIAGGFFQGNNYQGDVTTKIALTQKLSSLVSIDAATERKPYQYTLASVKNPFLYNVSEAGFNFGNMDHWLARVAYQKQSFDDGNSAKTFYAWLLAPLVQKNGFSLKAGYAFSYANADRNTFEPKDSLDGSAVPDSPVEGAYNPYFTPSQQYINAALISFSIPVSKAVTFSTRASLAFSATANQPSLVVSRNGSGPFFVKTNYGTLQYHPVEVYSKLSIRLSKQFYINGNYAYNSLIYFKSNSGNIELKYLFINAKGK